MKEITGIINAYGCCTEEPEDFGIAFIGNLCLHCFMRDLKGYWYVIIAHGGDESIYRGNTHGDHGARGWSEWTPAEPPTLVIGDESLLDELHKLHGKMVHIRLDERRES